MSNFNRGYLRAMNPSLGIAMRFLGFRECCTAFAGGTGISYQTLCNTLGTRFGFDYRMQRPNEQQLMMAMSVLVAVRFQLLHQRHLYDIARLHEKLNGKRKYKKYFKETIDPLALIISHDLRQSRRLGFVNRSKRCTVT